jgi:hypothetical protein
MKKPAIMIERKHAAGITNSPRKNNTILKVMSMIGILDYDSSAN